MRNRWIGRALFKAAVIQAIVLAWAAAALAYSVSYDQKMTVKGQVINSKVLYKDSQFRIETAVQGMKTYLIKNQRGLFQYLPDQAMAMSLQGLMPGQAMIEDPEDYLAYLKKRNAQYLGSELIGGKRCDVYQFDDPNARGTVKAWVWKEKRFPVRLEIDGAQGNMVIEISNVLVGAGIRDTVFQLPEGVQVMSMGQMMQGMTDLLQGGQ